jgi:hypothetical protein
MRLDSSMLNHHMERKAWGTDCGRERHNNRSLPADNDWRAVRR